MRKNITTEAGLRLLTILAWISTSSVVSAAEGSKDLPQTARATFAGGCFWCSEADFEKVDGVVSVISGYIGGEKKSPTYEEVSAGVTGHAEAVEVIYDPSRLTYEDLLEVFWHSIDPTVKNRQFCDRGSQYRSGIFYHDEEQRQAAERSKTKLMEDSPFEVSIVTEITASTEFYEAEGYHQDYYRKNPIRYRTYREGCGRDRRLQELWGEER